MEARLHYFPLRWGAVQLEKRTHSTEGWCVASLLGWRAKEDNDASVIPIPTRSLFPGPPSCAPTPRQLSFIPRRACSWSRAGQKEFSNSRQEERPGITKNIPSCVYKKEAPPPTRLQGAPDGAGQAPTTGTDSLTPRFRAVSGQPGHGPCARLANHVVPLSANQPIVARPRSKFEWQLFASRSAESIAAPNSNQRSLTLAISARGGACPAWAGNARCDCPGERKALQFRVRPFARLPRPPPWLAAVAPGRRQRQRIWMRWGRPWTVSARFAPFTLPLFPRAKALGRGWAPEDFRSTSCPGRHLWRSSQGTVQSSRADGPILWESSLRSCVVCRAHGVAAPRQLAARLVPPAPDPARRLFAASSAFSRVLISRPLPRPVPATFLARAHGTPGPRITPPPRPFPASLLLPRLARPAHPARRIQWGERLRSAPDCDLLADSGFLCLVTAPSLLVPCAAAGAC